MSFLFVVLQYLLPKHLLTAIIYRVARIRQPAVKNFLIEKFIKSFNVNVSEVRASIPDDFDTFNDFFIRELADGERPIADVPDAVVSPVDGTLSIAGHLEKDVIVQAKGIDYTLDELLATDLSNARAYEDGEFATIYLAPYNYHRVHAPFAGKLVAARYIPGDLFSVNAATVARVPKLFRRNERLVLHFETTAGPAAVIFVGALNVGSISTPWTGEIRPRSSGVVDVLDVTRHECSVEKGGLLGWFNMGSTVILLFPKGNCTWHEALRRGATLKMGEAIATLHTSGDD
jgi:phosphatidylserine decarboxylase